MNDVQPQGTTPDLCVELGRSLAAASTTTTLFALGLLLGWCALAIRHLCTQNKDTEEQITTVCVTGE